MAKIPGFVYVLKNEKFSHGIYKVGFTDVNPYKRAAELSSATGVPGSFDVVSFYVFCDAYSAEQVIHKILADKRIKNKEFFEARFTDIHLSIVNESWETINERFSANDGGDLNIEFMGYFLTVLGDQEIGLDSYFESLSGTNITESAQPVFEDR